MADSEKPFPLFLIFSEAGGLAGPQHFQYFLALDAAVAGGWKPARDLAEYAKHQSVIPSQEAAALAEGLENAIKWLWEHPRDAGEMERFRLLADYPVGLKLVRMLRGGDIHVADYTQPNEGRGWGLWVSPFQTGWNGEEHRAWLKSQRLEAEQQFKELSGKRP
jgi:hypothetical protein